MGFRKGAHPLFPADEKRCVLMMTMVVFEGGRPRGPVEGWLSDARSGMASALLRKGAESGAFGRIVLLTDKEVDAPAGVTVLDSSGLGPFRFGDALASVLSDGGISGFCYFSGGAVPLWSAEDLARFAESVERLDGAVLANNAFSADFFGSADKSPFIAEDLPSQDNSVPIYLSERGRAKLLAMPYTVEAGFDIDTPTDALILAADARCDASVKDRILKGPDTIPEGRIGLCFERLMEIKGLMHRDFSDISLIGRGEAIRDTRAEPADALPLQGVSEERGMRSFGRDQEGTARTVMAGLMDLLGEKGALELLMSQTQGILFDDRVLFAAKGAKPSAEERFLSDLMAWEAMPEGLPRRVAKAAYEVEGVNLGGHSLVNSGAAVLAK